MISGYEPQRKNRSIASSELDPHTLDLSAFPTGSRGTLRLALMLARCNSVAMEIDNNTCPGDEEDAKPVRVIWNQINAAFHSAWKLAGQQIETMTFEEGHHDTNAERSK